MIGGDRYGTRPRHQITALAHARGPLDQPARRPGALPQQDAGEANGGLVTSNGASRQCNGSYQLLTLRPSSTLGQAWRRQRPDAAPFQRPVRWRHLRGAPGLILTTGTPGPGTTSAGCWWDVASSTSSSPLFLMAEISPGCASVGLGVAQSAPIRLAFSPRSRRCAASSCARSGRRRRVKPSCCQVRGTAPWVTLRWVWRARRRPPRRRCGIVQARRSPAECANGVPDAAGISARHGLRVDVVVGLGTSRPGRMFKCAPAHTGFLLGGHLADAARLDG